MLLYLLIVHAIILTFLLTTCGIMVGSLIADLMDEQELETGKRQEGVFSSALSFSAKATSSLGINIGGFLLDFIVRFPKQAQIGTVDNDTLFSLAFCDGVAVPLLFFVPMINEAFHAWTDGVAEPEDIDSIMKLGCAFPMGPLRLADYIGLDVCHDIMMVMYNGLDENPKYLPSKKLVELVDQGHLGDKSGRGVYEYSGR